MNIASGLFMRLDQDMSGSISIDEIEEHLQDPAVRDFFRLIDVDETEAQCLFDILDNSGDGTIDLEEFLNGCLRLQGQAKSLDLFILTRDTRMAFETQSKHIGM